MKLPKNTEALLRDVMAEVEAAVIVPTYHGDIVELNSVEARRLLKRYYAWRKQAKKLAIKP